MSHRHARRIAQELVNDLTAVGAYPLPQDAAAGPGGRATDALVDRWERMVDNLLEPNLIPTPGRNCHSPNPAHVEAFLQKYPDVAAAIPEITARVLSVFPTGTYVELELCTDPEGCAVCHEIQQVVMSVRLDKCGGITTCQTIDLMDEVDEWMVDEEQKALWSLPLLVTV